MPAHNFMVNDVAGTAAAFAVFALFAFVPGYSLAWLLDLLDFRQRTPAARCALAIALSIGIAPIIAYLCGWAGFAPLWLAFAFVAIRDWRRLIPRGHRAAKIVAAVWLVLGTASLIDLQFGDRLYYSVIAHDYTMRIAITSAITRAGLPAINPYFFPGGPVPLRYHYFWMIVCSLAQRAGSLNARMAALGGTLWVGLGLMAIVALYLKYVDPAGDRNLRRRLVIGLALLGVTGLDLIPNLVMIRGGVMLPDMEWWNEQVTSWVGTMLWVPHHLASLVACLTGFLLLWNTPVRWRNAVVAGICFASAAGCSVYVTLTFAAFMAVWGLILLWRKWYRDAASMALAGGIAAVLVVPGYVLRLRGTAAGGSFLLPTIRTFKLVDLILIANHITGWKIHLANLLLLPVNYFFELGFFFVVGVLALKSLKPTRWNLAACAMLATSILICTFVCSGVIGNNDLGGRGFLPAQFVLLLWAVDILDKPRPAIVLLLIVGALGTVYQVSVLRFYPVRTESAPAPDYPWLATDRQFGKRNFATRQVYEQLRDLLPPNAVVEHNPQSELGDILHGMYADRQLAAEGLGCGTVLGGDEQICSRNWTALESLFQPSPDSPDSTCRDLSIDVVVARDTDPIWRDPQSWIWKRHPLAANSMLRALPCGNSLAPPQAQRAAN
jgi:hypothetical protein